jgi:hypothetical protein
MQGVDDGVTLDFRPVKKGAKPCYVLTSTAKGHHCGVMNVPIQMDNC